MIPRRNTRSNPDTAPPELHTRRLAGSIDTNYLTAVSAFLSFLPPNQRRCAPTLFLGALFCKVYAHGSRVSRVAEIFFDTFSVLSIRVRRAHY